MIRGDIFIDGENMRSRYGAYVIEGGYNDVPCFPPLKKPEINEWFEENGLDIDLSETFVESHKIGITLMMRGETKDAKRFIDFIMSRRVHSVLMEDIHRVRHMRVVDVSASGFSSLFTIRVNLSDDEPRKNLEPGEPFFTNRLSGFSIDGIDVARYGALIKGSLDGLFPDHTMKENELNSSSFVDGESHANGTEVYTETGDLRCHLVLRAEDVDQFWRMRDALFVALTQPGVKWIAYRGTEYGVYYKSCNSIRFDYSGKCWWEFELVFGFIE